jgi:BirA family biotin operon repressor/biotin-[acetyl-CoA-carboxylase] ligase
MSLLTTTEQALLSLLADKQFHSGEALAEHFQVSRTAISNWLKKLNQVGIDVRSVKGKGYQLAANISLLDQGLLKQQLIGIPSFNYRFKTSSTNDDVKAILSKQALPIVVTTEQQTAGRGRRGREWISPFGQNLYFSLGLELNVPISQLSGLSLAVGLSLAESLINSGFPVQLKWPNDLYIEGKKIAGILVELDGAFETPCRVIVGVGINVNMDPHNTHNVTAIDQAWSCLAEHLGHYINRTQLLSTLLNNLVTDIDEFTEHGLSDKVSRWNEIDYFYQQPVQLIMVNEVVKGVCQGIDDSGALLLKTEQGIEKHIAGEISVRRLND